MDIYRKLCIPRCCVNNNNSTKEHVLYPTEDYCTDLELVSAWHQCEVHSFQITRSEKHKWPLYGKLRTIPTRLLLYIFSDFAWFKSSLARTILQYFTNRSNNFSSTNPRRAHESPILKGQIRIKCLNIQLYSISRSCILLDQYENNQLVSCVTLDATWRWLPEDSLVVVGRADPSLPLSSSSRLDLPKTILLSGS